MRADEPGLRPLSANSCAVALNSRNLDDLRGAPPRSRHDQSPTASGPSPRAEARAGQSAEAGLSRGTRAEGLRCRREGLRDHARPRSYVHGRLLRDRWTARDRRALSSAWCPSRKRLVGRWERASYRRATYRAPSSSGFDPDVVREHYVFRLSHGMASSRAALGPTPRLLTELQRSSIGCGSRRPP